MASPHPTSLIGNIFLGNRLKPTLAGIPDGSCKPWNLYNLSKLSDGDSGAPSLTNPASNS